MAALNIPEPEARHVFPQRSRFRRLQRTFSKASEFSRNDHTDLKAYQFSWDKEWPSSTASSDKMCEACSELRLASLLCKPNRDRRLARSLGFSYSYSLWTLKLAPHEFVIQKELECPTLEFTIHLSREKCFAPSCPCCRFLWLAIKRAESKSLQGPIQTSYLSFSICSSHWYDVSLALTERPSLPFPRDLITRMIFFRTSDFATTHSDNAFIPTSKSYGSTSTSPPFMAGKRVFNAEVDYAAISNWLDKCSRSHSSSCKPQTADVLLKTRLVDVELRQVVRHPGVDVRYIALSYVWGRAEQPIVGFGPLPTALPATIEDSMTFAKALGLRYLWVDALCIDQGDIVHKMEQIGFMESIYSSAFATLISLDAESAESGLPRITRNASSPNEEQLYAEFDGIQLVSAPTPLSKVVKRSIWNRRAWTFQEGLLSNRRLLVSKSEIFFECNRMTCSESFDYGTAFGYSSPGSKESAMDCLPVGSLSRGVLCPDFHNPWLADSGDKALEGPQVYAKMISEYSTKEMSWDSDALNAITGILTKLELIYFPAGFFHGLPLELFRSTLYFEIPMSPGYPDRRWAHPSWSWVGWKGEVKYINVQSTYDFQQPLLRLHYAAGLDWKPVPEMKMVPCAGYENASRLNDLLSSFYNRVPPASSQEEGQMLSPIQGTILVEGLILRVRLVPRGNAGSTGLHYFDQSLPIDDNIIAGYTRLFGPSFHDFLWLHIKLERTVWGSFEVSIAGLVLEWEDGMAHREQSLRLRLEYREENLERLARFLDSVSFRRRTFLLA